MRASPPRAADRLGLADRGRIALGKRRDLVLLDPDRYIDTATYAEPDRSPDGVIGVWVNGLAACVTASRPALARAVWCDERMRETGDAMAVTRIVQLTDLHLFEAPDQRLFGIPTRELLLDVVAHVREHAGRVDHLVVTGDHTHDELTVSYEAVREILRPWHDRLWLVPGNHEDRTRLRSTFDDRIRGTGAERIDFAFAAGEVALPRARHPGARSGGGADRRAPRSSG